MNYLRKLNMKKFITERKNVTFKELCEAFSDYTPMTIRRDINLLHAEGFITRFHGGVALAEDFEPKEEEYGIRAFENNEVKGKIASRAASLITPNGSLFLDSGSTLMSYAKLIGGKGYNVITPAANIALELLKNPKNTVTLCGGLLDRSTLAVRGALALPVIQTMNIDTAVMAASSISLDGGFTCGTQEDSILKSAAIRKARRVVMLADSSKFDKMLPYTFAQLEEIDMLITDTALIPEMQQKFQEANVQVVLT